LSDGMKRKRVPTSGVAEIRALTGAKGLVDVWGQGKELGGKGKTHKKEEHRTTWKGTRKIKKKRIVTQNHG